MAKGKHAKRAEARREAEALSGVERLRSRVSAAESQAQDALRQARDRNALAAEVDRLRGQLAEACSDELADMHRRYAELSAAFSIISWRINTIQTNWEKIVDKYMDLVGPSVHGSYGEKLHEELTGVHGVLALHVNPDHVKGLSDKATAAIELARRRKNLINWRGALNMEGKRQKTGAGGGKDFEALLVKPDSERKSAK